MIDEKVSDIIAACAKNGVSCIRLPDLTEIHFGTGKNSEPETTLSPPSAPRAPGAPLSEPLKPDEVPPHLAQRLEDDRRAELLINSPLDFEEQAINEISEGERPPEAVDAEFGQEEAGSQFEGTGENQVDQATP